MMRDKQKKKIALAVLVSYTALTGAPAFAVPRNTQLPTGFKNFVGGAAWKQEGHVGTVTQTGQTAVNKWENFSIGADAAVNFKKKGGGQFNSVNYVNSGTVSEIYGQLNAAGGNIFIANPAGVQIGSSAQINVGSIYVTNKNLSGIEKNLNAASKKDAIVKQIAAKTATNAELMSLGDVISAGNVTFDGGRIVIDADRLYKNTGGAKLDTGTNLTVKTTDKENVVIGTKAEFDKDTKKFKDGAGKKEITVSDGTKFKSYTWIEDLAQLQAMKDVTDGWFALRNSIDANYTRDNAYDYGGDSGKGFKPIGNAQSAFTGRFDGLGFNIFDLNIKRTGEDYAGLFGATDGATLRNFTINSGSIAGGNNTGAVAGHVKGGTIDNVINSANVTGSDNNVGGLVGHAEGGAKLSGLSNIGTVKGTNNVGGIVGEMNGSTVGGATLNHGKVKGTGSSVGGIAGKAENSTIGNDGKDSFTIYNQFGVEGGTDVGGIVGSMKGTTVQNVANYGTVLATGKNEEVYNYRSHWQWVSDISGSTIEGLTDTEDGVASINTYVANAGGIVGKSESTKAEDGSISHKSTITNATNEGDVATKTTDGGGNIGTYYNAGNVGGIVGRATDTDLTDVTNKENSVAGAHNVGGIAGYLGGNSKINRATNNGGDITVTGARRVNNTDVNSGFVQEGTRSDGSEKYNVGNAGGIVGYMYGDDVHVSQSANRGTVHSAKIESGQDATESAKASSVGGIAGRVDRSKTKTAKEIQDDPTQAAISDSYNTGAVEGYTGVGGIAGFMYNGEVARSYNSGDLSTLRTTQVNSSVPLNMGGIVGDSTEDTQGRIYLYDVYNTGKIGDPSFTYHGRHMGGLVGRLSGSIEKAYNTGDIYNGNNVVGGIAGYWYAGEYIKDVFNAGNITLKNTNTGWRAQLGGIVGAVNLFPTDKTLSNAYNLGTIRLFRDGSSGWRLNMLGGIVGGLYAYEYNRGANYDEKKLFNLYIKDVYTLGHLYAGTLENGEYKLDTDPAQKKVLGAIVGSYNHNDDTPETDFKEKGKVHVENAHYIKPGAEGFLDLSGTDANTVIEYNDRYKADSYHFSNGLQAMNPSKDFTVERDEKGDPKNAWRVYDNTTPMLNAFIPEAEKFFSKNGLGDKLDSIQYGTAFNPLQTFLHAKENSNLEYNWGELGLSGASGLSVFGNSSLTLNGFASRGDNLFFGGTIYSDGALTVNGTGSNFNLGAGSRLYGSSVTLDANGGDVKMNGLVQSTDGDITVNGGNVEILGQLNASHAGEPTTVSGVNDTPDKVKDENINDPTKSMESIHDRFSHTTGKAAKDGSIRVTASGDLDLRYGYLGTGEVTAGGDITLQSTGGKVYVDTLFKDLGGNLTLESGKRAELDLSNMGDYDLSLKKDGKSEENVLGSFLDHFKNDGTLNFNGSGAKKLAYDMWDYDKNEFDLSKYGDTLADDILNLNVSFNGTALGKSKDDADRNALSYIWIKNAEQLKGIQEYYKAHTGDGKGKTFLGYNFALKNNIDASGIEGYEAIGTDSDDGYRGHFDGRKYAIFGLNVGKADGSGDNSSAALFDRIAEKAEVKDLGVYSSSFYGKDYAGTIAGQNNGSISGVFTLGNHVEAFGSSGSASLAGVTIDENGATAPTFGADVHVGAAGGIAGLNKGTITDIDASDSVVAGKSEGGAKSTAGGVAGINEGLIGAVKDENGNVVEAEGIIAADSSVTANDNTGTGYSLGGIAGVNKGTVQNADSTGLVHGEYGGNVTADNVGGIAGVNAGTVADVYNEAGIIGGSNVGGVAGFNMANGDGAASVTGAVNAGDIKADYQKDGKYYNYTGGIAGFNGGTVEGGRNAGTIDGGNRVGGIVGGNGKDVVLRGLSNSLFATVTGEEYVGGVAGSNAGTITGSDDVENLGKVYGQKFVGGIAGLNAGTIQYTINEMNLYAKEGAQDAQYFGGIAGQNTGTITEASNKGEVSAEDASFVGGIAGMNGDDQGTDGVGKLEGDLVNEGKVTGKANVGGIAGSNKNKTLLKNDGGDEKHMQTLTNKGAVEAKQGGAGGIFFENESAMEWVKLVNEGKVTGGADENGEGQNNVGGIFGTNSGSAEHSVFVNDGVVTGQGNNVGGLFGQNSGNFTNSSLMATVGSQVSGGSNVGGLIGENSGEVKGGRDEKNEYYKYVVYNNGSVSGTSDVGGLIGKNDAAGKLDAAYNTGTVTAEGDNAGGIVGTNEGAVTQVFNTVMPAPQPKTRAAAAAAGVSGANNVGGIAGRNADSGTISDSYSTSTVAGTSAVGNAVGKNEASASVQNVYSTNESGTLFGDNQGTVANAYSYSAADAGVEGVTVIDEDARFSGESYEGFEFDGDAPMWKIYEGFGAPLLKVFLTKATYDGGKGRFVFDGKVHKMDPRSVTAADGLAAFRNAQSLLEALGNSEVGEDYLAFLSQQIASSMINGVFNPNNLGYDIDVTYDIVEGSGTNPNPNFGWLYQYGWGWDRIRNARERKAELNFVEGGMVPPIAD